MLRRLYGLIIRLHPRRFRDSFGQEMLSIFDEPRADQATARLLADGAMSLVRQWALRSASGVPETAETGTWSNDGAPVFHILGDYRPRTSSLISGGMLTLVVFCAAWLACEYAWTHPVFMPLATVQFESGPDLSRTKEPPAPYPPLRGTAASANEIGAQSRPKAVPNSFKPTLAPPSNPPVSQPNVSTVTNAQSSAKPPAQRANREAARATSSPVLPARNPVVARTIPEPAILSCVGVYESDPPNSLIIAVTAEEGRLAIQIAGEPETKLTPLSGTDLIFSDSRNDFVEFVAHGHAHADEVVIYRNGRRVTARTARTPYR